MKKNKLTRHLLVASLATFLISTSVFSTTLAKYVSSINGTISGTTHEWDVALTTGQETFTLTSTIDKYAPGMSEEFTVEIKNNCALDAMCTVDLKDNGTTPKNMLVSVEGNALIKAGETQTITIKLSWPYETFGKDGTTSEGDKADTLDAGKEYALDIVITASQVQPSE